MERDGCAVVENGGLDNFNSHAHVERDRIVVTSQLFFLNFNSHAHVERDQRSNGKTYAVCISTHTLTWSVTNVVNLLEMYNTISTHTLTWSVTMTAKK